MSSDHDAAGNTSEGVPPEHHPATNPSNLETVDRAEMDELLMRARMAEVIAMNRFSERMERRARMNRLVLLASAFGIATIAIGQVIFTVAFSENPDSSAGLAVTTSLITVVSLLIALWSLISSTRASRRESHAEAEILRRVVDAGAFAHSVRTRAVNQSTQSGTHAGLRGDPEHGGE